MRVKQTYNYVHIVTFFSISDTKFKEYTQEIYTLIETFKV